MAEPLPEDRNDRLAAPVATADRPERVAHPEQRESAAAGTQPRTDLQGWTATIASFEDAVRAVEWAFDYRGDVTIVLGNGEQLVGYVFNRDASANPPFLQMFLKGQPAARRILLADIVSVWFSGPDAAA